MFKLFPVNMTIGQSIHFLYFLTGYQVAGAEGIEPSSKVLETPILPLNYAPIKFYRNDSRLVYYITLPEFCQAFFQKSFFFKK